MTDDLITSEMFDAAFKWASNIYAGKRDKQNKPLILHAVRVMVGVTASGPAHMLVGLLHDTIEETAPGEIAEAIRVLNNFPLVVVRAVLVLTRKKPERYPDYIRRVFLDSMARTVKLADLADNMDLTRGSFEGQASLFERYRRSAAYLRSGDEGHFSRFDGRRAL